MAALQTLAEAESLSQLRSAVEDLERKLREAKRLQGVVDFDVEALRARKVTREKRDPRLQLASGGAAQLAEEVAQELQEWRKKREEAYAQRRRVMEKRHRDTVQNKKQQQQDKQMIRDFLHELLKEQAKEALGGAKKQNAQNARSSPFTPEEVVLQSCSAGATALLTLRQRLEDAVERVEAIQPQAPPEMVEAGRLAQKAVERKRDRVKASTLKERLELTDHELVEEVERGFVGRQQALQAQSEDLRQVVNSLRSSVDHRQQAFQELDALNKGPAAVAPAAWWKVLHGEEDTASEEETRPEPGEEELRAQLQKQVADWGRRRIEEISEAFYKRYSRSACSADDNHDTWLAESELEVWKLREKLELLQELRKEAVAWHSKKMQNLWRLQDRGSKQGPGPSDAAAAVDAFLSLKAGIHKSLQGIISAEVADHSLSRLKQVNSWHQNHTQMIKEQEESAQGVADDLVEWARARCGWQLAEAAQQLLQQCHQALPVAHTESVMSPRLDDRPVAEHFQALSADIAGLEATPETCVLQQQMLNVIDTELQRLCALFRSRDTSKGA